MRKIILLLTLFIMSSCMPMFSPQTYRTVSMKYGEESSTKIGGDIAVWETGLYMKGQKEGVEHHLVYAGISENTITIYYVEYYVKDYFTKMARDAFNMRFKYDLSKSNTIAYRNIKIKILRADNEKIDFIVIEGPSPIIPKENKNISPTVDNGWDL